MAYKNRNFFLIVLMARSLRSVCFSEGDFQVADCWILLVPSHCVLEHKVLLNLFYKDTHLIHDKGSVIVWIWKVLYRLTCLHCFGKWKLMEMGSHGAVVTPFPRKPYFMLGISTTMDNATATEKLWGQINPSFLVSCQLFGHNVDNSNLGSIHMT